MLTPVGLRTLESAAIASGVTLGALDGLSFEDRTISILKSWVESTGGTMPSGSFNNRVLAALETIAANGAGGGGTLTGAQWAGDTPKSTPETESDDFPAGALNAKWTVWDPSSRLTETPTPDGGLTLKYLAGAGSYGWAGIVQPAPADNYFSVTAKCLLGNSGLDYEWGSVLVGEDLVASPATAGFGICGQTRYGANDVGTGQWTNSTSWANNNVQKSQTYVYFRIFVDRVGAVVHYLASLTGEEGSWSKLGTNAISGAVASIDTIGIGLCSDNTTAVQMRARNFEVYTAASASIDERQTAVGSEMTVS